MWNAPTPLVFFQLLSSTFPILKIQEILFKITQEVLGPSTFSCSTRASYSDDSDKFRPDISKKVVRTYLFRFKVLRHLGSEVISFR
jgi:hypothetical protein